MRLKYDEIKMRVLLWIRNLIVRLAVGIIFLKMLTNSFKRHFRSTCKKNGTNDNHANFQSNQAAKKDRKKKKRKLVFARINTGRETIFIVDKNYSS